MCPLPAVPQAPLIADEPPGRGHLQKRGRAVTGCAAQRRGLSERAEAVEPAPAPAPRRRVPPVPHARRLSGHPVHPARADRQARETRPPAVRGQNRLRQLETVNGCRGRSTGTDLPNTAQPAAACSTSCSGAALAPDPSAAAPSAARSASSTAAASTSSAAIPIARSLPQLHGRVLRGPHGRAGRGGGWPGKRGSGARSVLRPAGGRPWRGWLPGVRPSAVAAQGGWCRGWVVWPAR